jgi:hypothetical protein
MSYLRLDYIGKSSLRLVIKENENKEPDYITKHQYQSKIRQKPSSTPPTNYEWAGLYIFNACTD